MKNLIKKIFSIFSILILLASCASKENVVYFQDVEGISVNDSLINFEPKIQIGDILSINVSAVDAEAALPFNLYETPIIGTYASNAKPLTYLVDSEGNINFPVIGKFKIEGLTTKETNDKLTKILEDYIKNPIINIRLTNFKVTVMGEVVKPGTYIIPNERISVLDAIGLAGDLTIYGNRKTVLLIREQDGKRMMVNMDLTNKQLFNSPYFYLSQNDVVYIEPNKTKVNSSNVGPNTTVIISSISLLITLAALLIK
jgi:polysaccharide export outer membrane protein